MTARFLELKTAIKYLTESPDKIEGLTVGNHSHLTRLSLTTFEWKILNLLNEILSPLAHATTILSGQNYATLSLAFYVKKGLLRFFDSDVAIEGSPDKKIKEVEKEMKALVCKYLKVYFIEKCTKDQKLLTLLAGFFDPKTFGILESCDIQEVKNYLVKNFPPTRTRRCTISTTNVAESSIPTAQVQQRNRKKSSAMDEFADMCSMNNTRPEPESSTNVVNEFNLYQVAVYENGTLTLKEFWSIHSPSFPILSELVKKVKHHTYKINKLQILKYYF